MLVRWFVAAFGIAAEVASLTAEPGGSPERSLWELPVYVMDVGFAFFIMTGLASIRVQLQQEGQAVKLEMYNQLARVLCSFLAIVCIMAVATIFVEVGVVAFPWKTLWIFTNFWDLLYYIVLVAVREDCPLSSPAVTGHVVLVLRAARRGAKPGESGRTRWNRHGARRTRGSFFGRSMDRRHR